MTPPPLTLVTGALGFVAHWLIADLLQGGARVFGVGHLPASGEPPARWGPFRCEGPAAEAPAAFRFVGPGGSWLYEPCGLEVDGAIADVLARHRPATVYHLAAQSSAGLSFHEPVVTLEFNARGTLRLLEAIRGLPAAQRPLLLAAGSCEEYGAEGRRRAPLHERSALAPVSPYGVSKVAQSLLCLQYHRSYGLPVIVTRAFSHTGPGHDVRFAFPSFARQIADAEQGRREPTLTVGNLSPVRDYLDVRDVSRAYQLLAERGEPGQIYNVCSGRALTIGQGLEILLRGARCEITIAPDPERQRPSDIPYMVGDGTKLRQRTAWRPKHDIRDTLQDLLAWARKESS
jgi:GDP-4-dehydro-6-deoxy-D-mannose reductase